MVANFLLLYEFTEGVYTGIVGKAFIITWHLWHDGTRSRLRIRTYSEPAIPVELPHIDTYFPDRIQMRKSGRNYLQVKMHFVVTVYPLCIK